MVGPILWSIEPLTFMCKGGLTIERRVASSRRISLPPRPSLPPSLIASSGQWGENRLPFHALHVRESRVARRVTWLTNYRTGGEHRGRSRSMHTSWANSPYWTHSTASSCDRNTYTVNTALQANVPLLANELWTFDLSLSIIRFLRASSSRRHCGGLIETVGAKIEHYFRLTCYKY